MGDNRLNNLTDFVSLGKGVAPVALGRLYAYRNVLGRLLTQFRILDVCLWRFNSFHFPRTK